MEIGRGVLFSSRFVSMRKNMENTINLFLANITKMKEEINVLELLIQKKVLRC